MKNNKTEKSILLTGGSKGEINLDYRILRKAVLNVRAIDHDIRKKIIGMLLEKGAMTVTEIHNALNIEQSVVSQHLAVLRRAGLVQTDRNRKFIAYSVNTERLNEISQFIDKLVS